MTTLSVGQLTGNRDVARGGVCARSLSFWLLVGLCLFSALLGRLGYIIRPFDSDGSMFIYMGRLITEGGRFCHDICDNKFPTVGLITSVPWRMFGPVWSEYVLLDTVLSLLTASLLARMAARHFGEHAGTPTLLYSVVYLNITFVVFGGFQLETLQIFFSVLAAGACLELLRRSDFRDAVTVGLATGCAAMLKPTGVSVTGAFAVTLAIFHWREPRRLLKNCSGIAVGLAIPAAVVLFYLVRADNLVDMPGLYRQIATYAKSSSLDWWDAIKPLTVLVLGGFPLFVRMVIFRRSPDRLDVRTNKPAAVFVVLWAAMELIGVIAQRRMYAYHFMVLGPPMALLFGLVPRKDRLVPLAAALIPMCLFSVYGTGLLLAEGYQGQERMDVSEYLAARAQHGDAVWMDDAARVILETGMQPGSRLPLTFLFCNSDTAGVEYSARIIRDFDCRLPEFVVLPAAFEKMLAHQGHEILELNRFPVRRENYCTGWRNIRGYVLQNYALETRIGPQEIYRRIHP